MSNKKQMLLSTAKWDASQAKRVDLEQSLKVAKEEIDKSIAVNIQLGKSNQIEQDGLQSKIMSQQKKLEKAKCRNSILEQERRKAEEERRTVDNERHKAEEDIKKLTTQLQEARERTTATDIEVVKRVEKCEGCLEKPGACIDSLPAPQSLSERSDSDVASRFTSLLEHINSWVDEELYEPRSLQKLEEVLTKQHLRPRLGCLSEHLGHEHGRLAEEYVTSQRPLLCSLIYRHLRSSILGERVPLFGIDDEEADEVSQALCSALSYLLQDGHSKKEARDKLHQQITAPAVQLARSIRLSTAENRIVRGRPRGTIVCKEDMQRYTIKDLATQRSVAPRNVGMVGRDGRIGEQKLMVYPGLLRRHDRDGRDILLCKPLILVDLDAPLRPRSRLSY